MKFNIDFSYSIKFLNVGILLSRGSCCETHKSIKQIKFGYKKSYKIVIIIENISTHFCILHFTFLHL